MTPRTVTKKLPTPKAKKAAGKTRTPERQAHGTGSFVLLSDLHAHVWGAFARGDGARNTRLQRSIAVLDASLRRAQELGVPWVFAGDLVHTAGYTYNVVLNELSEVLARYNDVHKYAVWGNHDARGIGGKITIGSTVFSTLLLTTKNLHVLDPCANDGIIQDAGTGLVFAGAGYQPAPHLLTLAPPSHVGIYHQTVRGSQSPHGVVFEEGVDADELLARHRCVVVGHVHHWQYHDAAQRHPRTMLLVPGSPEHHNFGDSGEHGWWVVTLNEDDVTAEMVPGGSPKFLTVNTPADALDDGNFYRVRYVRAGDAVPAGVNVIAPAQTVVTHRDTLQSARGEETLHVWLKTQPPGDSIVPLEQYLAKGCQLLGAQDACTVRPLRLRSVRLTNFCCYGDSTLNVTAGSRLVLGKGRDFTSNGAGKTTLWEAVYWALFGQTTKGLKGDEVVRWGADSCEVALRLSSEDGTETVDVRRKRGKDAGLYVTTQDGSIEGRSSAEVTDKLIAYLGVTPALYQALAYFSQERLLLFASATDAERKEMLADLVGLAAYQEAAVAVGKEATEVERRATHALVTCDALRSQLTDAEAHLEQQKEMAAQWLTAQKEKTTRAAVALSDYRLGMPQKIADEVRQIQAREGTELAQQIAAAQTEYEQLHKQVPHVIPSGPTRADWDTMQERSMAAQQFTRQTHTQLLLAQQKRTELLRRIEAQSSVLSTGVCPTCAQAVTSEQTDRCVAPLHAELEPLTRKCAELEKCLQERLATATAMHREVESVGEKVREVERQQVLRMQCEAAFAKLRQLEGQRVLAEDTVRTKVTAHFQVEESRLEYEYMRLMDEKNPHTAVVDAAKKRIRVLRGQVEEQTTIEKQARADLAVLEYWRHGFSRQGLQSLLVDEVAAQFNRVRNTIFPVLTQGVYDVQFSTISSTKAGEAREKTEFQVFQHGEPLPYSALSGGQRRRVDVGVMLTLILAVSQWLRIPGIFGVLLLDEVFGFLDASGAEGLVAALQEVQDTIPSIFVVSHDTQLQALFSEVIEVVQDKEGVSRIVAMEEA